MIAMVSCASLSLSLPYGRKCKLDIQGNSNSKEVFADLLFGDKKHMKLSTLSGCRAATRLAIPLLGIILSAGCSSGNDTDANEQELTSPDPDSPFFENFSQPLLPLELQDRTSDEASTDFNFADGSVTITVASTGEDRERGRVTPRGRFDSYSTVVAIEPGSEVSGEGRIRALIQSFLYNDTTDSPEPGDGDCFAGDVGAQVILEQNANGERSFIFNAFRETQSECGLTEEPPVFDGESFLRLEQPAEAGVSYRLAMAIDRDNRTLTMSIDDEIFTYALMTDVFEPGLAFSTFESRIERGPGTGIVRFDEVSVDGQRSDFSDPDLFDRFSFWDAGDPGTSITYPDGEVRLESAANSNSRGHNRLAVTGLTTRYASATIRLSSESIVSGDGDARARVAGAMYYASDTAGDESSLNQVFAVTEIRLLESGATEARYCAFQSLDETFSDSISLVNPDDESGCNTFALTPVLDQDYTIATWMDDANRRIVFSIDDEVHFHDVEGPISIGDDLFSMRIASRASGEGSRAVVFADSLASDPSVGQ